MIRYVIHGTAAYTGAVPTQQRIPGERGAPDGPIRDDFPPGAAGLAAYHVAWRAWLKQIDDGLMTIAERDVRARLYAGMFDVPEQVARMLTLQQLRYLTGLPDRGELVIAALLESAPAEQ